MTSANRPANGLAATKNANQPPPQVSIHMTQLKPIYPPQQFQLRKLIKLVVYSSTGSKHCTHVLEWLGWLLTIYLLRASRSFLHLKHSTFTFDKLFLWMRSMILWRPSTSWLLATRNELSDLQGTCSTRFLGQHTIFATRCTCINS